VIHKYTNGVGWAASGLAGVGAAIGSAASGIETTIINGLATAAIGAMTMVVGRLLWDGIGVLTAKWKPKPVECPIGLERCPMSAAALARASSHDLAAEARATKPEKD